MASRTVLSLVSHLRRGERADPALVRRLDEVFGAHEAPLRAWVARELPGAPEQAIEDVVQQVLETAWRRFPTFRGESAFRTWLFAIASRTCANHRRKRHDVLSEDGWLEEADDAAPALALLAREERAELIHEAAVVALDPREQELAWLRYGLDASLEEIARDLGFASVEQVRVDLQRCRRRLHREVRRRLEILGHGSSFVREDPG